MKYRDFNILYKNNDFRKIDEQSKAKKFYLLRSISKSKTLKCFCEENNVPVDLDEIMANANITEEIIINFIRKNFKPKTSAEIKQIEQELNKMQYFDWGGSAGNSLEKNIINNFVKKMPRYNDICKALNDNIMQSVYGYTMNSWYNHWSSIMIEEIFNKDENVLPTIDLVEKTDFFIKETPYDLKVTYFPEELMKKEIAADLLQKYGSKNELTCTKKIAKLLDIAVPSDLNGRELTICLQNLLKESVDERARKFIADLTEIKRKVIDFYKENPNKLIVWLYENQGERRFDAANRFYVVLIDSENTFDSWKLKRNVNMLKDNITVKIKQVANKEPNFIRFYWEQEEKMYTCISELMFICK